MISIRYGGYSTPEKGVRVPVSNLSAHLDPATTPGRVAEPEREAALQAAVQELFQSAPFRSSRQCQDLLRYIVTHSFAGDDLLLRERVIGMEVFARRPDYDTGDDPVVRLRASELRKRLAQFYQSEAGKAAHVQIAIPSGSYRANFTWQLPPASMRLETEQAQGSQELARLEALPDVGPRAAGEGTRATLVPVRSKLLALGWIPVAGLLCCAVVGFLYWRGGRNSALNQFWGPLMDDPHPTLVCMGSNAVYRLSNNYLTEYQKRTGQAHDGIEFLIDPTPGEKLDQRDLLRAVNSFVALGDVAAASQFVSFLGQHGKSFTERFPPDMSFAEVQEYSSVLIGGFNNQMALTITKDLPFVFKGSDRIEERANPQHNWRLQFYGDARESEDYALISRIVDPVTQHEVVTLGGIGQYGTQAAADFLTDPAAMKEWTATLPRGWGRKNLQVVLHVKVLDYRPVKREIVDSKIW